MIALSRSGGWWAAGLLIASTLAMSYAVVSASPQDQTTSSLEDVEVAGGSMPLHLTFDRPQQPRASTVTRFVNSGDADLSIGVTGADGGRVRSLDSHGQSLRMPPYVPSRNEPRAVLWVRDSPGGIDTLDPGSASFVFGADIKLDERSDGTAIDDGDNLLQRGLIDDDAQYKLEIDFGRPACSIRGSSGQVMVVSPSTLPRDTWHRVRCWRHPRTVKLVVINMRTGATTVTVEDGWSGSVKPSSEKVPLSIGGKLKPNRSLIEATDQFNGVIDEVKLRIL